MKILALDPAQKCGWAHSDGSFSTIVLPGELGTQHACLFLRLEELITQHGCDMIASENAGFGSHNPATQAMHNERLGVIRLVAARRHIKLQTFQPTTIKSFATGNGAADKQQMIAAAVRLLGVRNATDDEADALWILELAKRPDCWPQAKKAVMFGKRKVRRT